MDQEHLGGRSGKGSGDLLMGLRPTFLLPLLLGLRKWLSVPKCLPWEQVGAQHPRKNPGVAVNAQNPNTGRQSAPGGGGGILV